MATLTPSLTTRTEQRRLYLNELHNSTSSLTTTPHLADLHRHQRFVVHPDPDFRAKLRDERRKHNEIGHRYLRIRKAVEKLDLSNATDWATFQGIYPYDSGIKWWDVTKTLTTAFPKFSTLPAVTLTDAEEAEWAYETTIHEINEALELELAKTLGAKRSLVALGVASLTTEQTRICRMLERRYDAMIALTTFPDDPYDLNLWGHDTRLRSLRLENGIPITLTPAFSPDVRKYTMPYRPNQVHRVDYATEDSNASATDSETTEQIKVTVTSEAGDTGEYVIEGDADASLSALVVKTGGTNRALTPAFAADTLAYESPSTIPLGALTVTATPTTAGATAVVSFVPSQSTATSITVVVTAADGSTTRTYTITRASG